MKKNLVTALPRPVKVLSHLNSTMSSESSKSSEDECNVPTLSYVRSFKEISKKIDKSLAKLGKSQAKGNDNK